MPKHLSAFFILVSICLFALKSNAVLASGSFSLSPPYSYAAHYIYQPSGGSSQSVIDRFLGTGFVKAKPAAPPLFSSLVYGAASGITFITSEWNFSGINQPGSVTMSAQLQNLQISSPEGIPASLQVWLDMEDFNSNGTLFYAQPHELYSATSSHSSPINLNNSYSWNWLTGHLYRAVVFLIAAGAGARSYASSAQANFTLSSIMWGTFTPFPAVNGVYCKDGNKILYDNTSVLLAAGQPILVQGCLGFPNADSKGNITLVNPQNGNTYNSTPRNGLQIDSAGNFSASIPAPNLPNGPYIVRVSSATGNISEDGIDVTYGVFPAPTLVPLSLFSILAGLSIIPLLMKRLRKDGFPARMLHSNSHSSRP